MNFVNVILTINLTKIVLSYLKWIINKRQHTFTSAFNLGLILYWLLEDVSIFLILIVDTLLDKLDDNETCFSFFWCFFISSSNGFAFFLGRPTLRFFNGGLNSSSLVCKKTFLI